MGNCVTIATADFIEGFVAIGDFLRRQPRMEASMICKDGELLVLTEGMEIGIPVSGHFEGTAWISGANLYGLTQIAKKRPPAGDARVFIAEGKFHVDRTIVPLRFDAKERPAVIFIPKDAPLVFWLGLPCKHSKDEIADAGVTGMVEEAIMARDALVEKAAKLLAPLGVSQGALGKFIEVCLKS